mgnify:CR=1 FL=1
MQTILKLFTYININFVLKWMYFLIEVVQCTLKLVYIWPLRLMIWNLNTAVHYVMQ